MGSAFSASYVLDIATTAFPALVAQQPSGSLIYDASTTAFVSPAGDTDSFTLVINPGQVISVVVSPLTTTLQPRVQIYDSSNVSQTFGIAAGPGQAALIQPFALAGGSTYRIDVLGVSGTTGGYSIQVILNSAVELEIIASGNTNNSFATAQDINGSFINLDTSIAQAKRGRYSEEPTSWRALTIVPRR